MREIVLGLGANLGSRVATLRAALDLIEAGGDVRVEALSPFYETEPVGPPQPRFVNAAARLATELPLGVLLDRVLEVERALGRVRRERWGPRVVDLDLLWAGPERVCTDRLTVPHPRLRERAFVLAPLLDVLPEAPPDLAGALARLGGPPAVAAPGAREPAVRVAGREVLSVEAEGLDDADALAAALTGLGCVLAGTPRGEGLTCRVTEPAGRSDPAAEALARMTGVVAGGFRVRSACLVLDPVELRVLGREGGPGDVAHPIEAWVRTSNGHEAARLTVRREFAK